MKNDLKNFYKKAPVEEEVVQVKQRPGTCFKCGHGNFSLATRKEYIYRTCKQCGEKQEPIK